MVVSTNGAGGGTVLVETTGGAGRSTEGDGAIGACSTGEEGEPRSVHGTQPFLSKRPVTDPSTFLGMAYSNTLGDGASRATLCGGEDGGREAAGGTEAALSSSGVACRPGRRQLISVKCVQ